MSMKDSIFVGTNILVYGHDLDVGNKHEVAVEPDKGGATETPHR